jgi:hypothetical protein
MKHAFVIVLLLAGLTTAVPAFAQDEVTIDDVNAAPPKSAATDCVNCPPPRKYDSREVIKTRRDLERVIQTINTTSMAPEKPAESPAKSSPRIYVRPDVTLVNFVVHRYRVIYAPALVSASEVQDYPAPSVYRPARICKHGRYGSCRPLLRARG